MPKKQFAPEPKPPFRPSSYTSAPKEQEQPPANPEQRRAALANIRVIVTHIGTTSGYAAGAAWRRNIRQIAVDRFVLSGAKDFLAWLRSEGIIDDANQVIPIESRATAQREPGEDRDEEQANQEDGL